MHDPGQVVADLAASVAPGGDCLADIALLREEPDLAGPVASDPVVSRLVATLGRDLPRSLPLSGFAQNQVWCEIAALACELLAWTQRVALTGAARRREPKRLRLRLLSVAGRPARSGRRHLRRNSPPAGHPRPADQPGHPFDTEGETARARGTPPTGRDSRAAQHSLNVNLNVKSARGQCLRPPHHGRERSRLTRPAGGSPGHVRSLYQQARSAVTGGVDPIDAIVNLLYFLQVNGQRRSSLGT